MPLALEQWILVVKNAWHPIGLSGAWFSQIPIRAEGQKCLALYLIVEHQRVRMPVTLRIVPNAEGMTANSLG